MNITKKQTLNNIIKSFYRDSLVSSIATLILLIAIVFCIYINLLLGFVIIVAFLTGCTFAILLLIHNEYVNLVIEKLQKYLGYKLEGHTNLVDCDICGEINCNRHITMSTVKEPWKELFIDKQLDQAIDSFYSRILTSFVSSWFSLLSNDADFIQALKLNLREATSRVILKIKKVNAPILITEKLLPCVFSHYELIQKMLQDGVPINKFPVNCVLNEYAIHPAVYNRQTELDYLRAIAKCLIPRLCNNEYFNSKVFFSLVRELLACWVLLPLMDVISDPNLINLLVIIATNKTDKPMKIPKEKHKVMFLDEFMKNICTNNNNNSNSIGKPIIITQNDDEDDLESGGRGGRGDLDKNDDDAFLSDQSQLYAFMQFLKKQDAVDYLRFYLDVDNLNKESNDPKITTDPAKLSALHQQSEKLFKTYKLMMKNDEKKLSKIHSLAEAHDDVKKLLTGKWRKAFETTPEYYRLIYGNKEIQDSQETSNDSGMAGDRAHDVKDGAVSRLGSKLKGAIRGAIDGAPLEATEIPTVWDALTDEPPITTTGNSTMYTTVTQKIRKERGQNLDSFIMTFMQSIEQSTDIGEDVMSSTDNQNMLRQRKPTPPGRNSVFGDLFDLKKSVKGSAVSTTTVYKSIRSMIHGPSQCLIYILVKMLKTNVIIVKLVLGFINVSQKTVDILICKLIDKLLSIGLYEPRLAVLIRLLENHLFSPKEAPPSSTELLERQRQAKNRLDKIYKGLGSTYDTLQSPSLNKHLMYCLLDIILCELYPELGILNTNRNY